MRLGEKARELFEASGRTSGSPRLTALIRRAGLRARQKRRWQPRTTDSRHLCPIAPNHLAERPPPGRPSEVWQADITYVATKEGWLYVAGVLDACSRRIVGWAAEDAMPTTLAARAFERAVRSKTFCSRGNPVPSRLSPPDIRVASWKLQNGSP